MGIYINKEHLGVFCNKQPIEETNQAEFHRDELSDLLERQLAESRKLAKAIVHLQFTQSDWNVHQSAIWRKMGKRLDELSKVHQHQETLEHQVIDLLEKIEEQNTIMQQTINYDQRFHNDLYQKVTELSLEHEKLMDQLNQVERQQIELVAGVSNLASLNESTAINFEQLIASQDKLEGQMDDHLVLNRQIVQQINGLEETQDDVLHRVDQNEGMMEKVVQQIDYLRAILFERSSYLEEKIEKAVKSTTEYIEEIKN